MARSTAGRVRSQAALEIRKFAYAKTIGRPSISVRSARFINHDTGSAMNGVKILLAVGLAVGSLATGGSTVAAAAGPPVFTVYMAASGSDDNTGTSADSPVYSLHRVQDVLVAAKPQTDVEVRIAQGVYSLRPFQDWRFYIPGHTISFMPADYQYGDGINDIAGRPIFRNRVTDTGLLPGYWLQLRLPSDPADPLYNGGTSGLRFYYLQIEHYSAGGISIYGNSERTSVVTDPAGLSSAGLTVQGSAGLNGNTVFGMEFNEVGSKYGTSSNGCGLTHGYGAVLLADSSNNTVDNNHFIHVENNKGPDCAADTNLIHGLYIAGFSSGNEVKGNEFTHVSGAPVKLRDRSNNNTVESNTFTDSGDHGYYYEQFCATDCGVAHVRECASYGNRFAYNTLVSGYQGRKPPTFALDPAGATYAGAAAPCSIPAGVERLHTAGNVAG
jgi:hypothetical protein